MSFIACNLFAQNYDEETRITTEYPQFRTAKVVTAVKGDTLKLLGNIFLKDGSFVYKKGSNVLRANPRTIREVIFGDTIYHNCDTMMARVIDTCNNNMLLESRLIDQTTWVRRAQNSQDVTSLTMRDVIQFTTVESNSYDGDPFPVMRDYFFLYNDKIVHASDRVLIKKVPKEKRQQYRAITQNERFNWRNIDNLKELLKFLSGVKFDDIKI